jgi:hypothetical protein
VDGYHSIAFGGRLRFDDALATETAVGGIEDIHADEVEFRIREDGDGVVRSPKNVDDVDYHYSKVDLGQEDTHRRNYCRDNLRKRNVNKTKECRVKSKVQTVKRKNVCCVKSMAGSANTMNAYCDSSTGESARNWNDCYATWKADNFHAKSTVVMVRKDVVGILGLVVEDPVPSNPAVAEEASASTECLPPRHSDFLPLCSAIPATRPPWATQV